MPKTMTRVNNQSDIITLAKDLGVRPDWHEPDEQDVSARIIGTRLDNAMGSSAEVRSYTSSDGTVTDFTEFNVIIAKDGEDVAVVNLATLLAMAAGYKGV